MKIKEYIDERRLTQEEAAKEIGVSRQYLCDIINNKAIPGRQVALKIVTWSSGMVKLKDLWPADVLQIDPNDLIIHTN